MSDSHFYRVGKAKRTTDDVERFLGRKPITFDQFAHDYAFGFREVEKVATWLGNEFLQTLHVHELGEELVVSYIYQIRLYHWLEINDHGRFLTDNDL